MYSFMYIVQAIDYGLMCSCKVLNTLVDDVYICIRNADFVRQSVPIHPNHNEFDAFFLSHVCSF